MSGAVLFCHSVYLVRSPPLTTWSAFSMHRRAMVSPRESDGMLRSQASVCALRSAPIICGSSAQSCPSNSSAVVLFAEKRGMLMTPSCYFPPLDGWSLAPARFQRWRPVLLPPVVPEPGKQKIVTSGWGTSFSRSSHTKARSRHITSCSAL
ncbi:hypothetical protein TcG_07262 [Trypanosoma cruzi]|nr:hypothetical protein TcG_07262 [Trypanosoma cruzi]